MSKGFAPNKGSIKDVMESFYEACDDLNIKESYSVALKRNGSGVLSWPGGFAYTFRLDPKGQDLDKLALRVFYEKSNKDLDHIKEELETIREYLAKKNSDKYFVNFEVKKNFLRVEDELQDCILMSWVEGSTLLKYVDKILEEESDKSILRKNMLDMAEKLLRMFKFLHKNSMSHGDLQFNNIQVTKSGELKLLDYDSIFVPGLENKPQVVTGYAGFQHPNRINQGIGKRSKKADYFSEIILYMGFLVLAIDCNFWEEGKNDDGQRDNEYFIFTQSDFLQIKSNQPCDKLIQIRTLVETKGTDDEESRIKEKIKCLLDLMIENLLLDDIESIIPMKGLDGGYCRICGSYHMDGAKYCTCCGCKILMRG